MSINDKIKEITEDLNSVQSFIEIINNKQSLLKKLGVEIIYKGEKII